MNSRCRLGRSAQPAPPWGFCALGEQKESQHLEKIPVTKRLSKSATVQTLPTSMENPFCQELLKALSVYHYTLWLSGI